MPWQLYSRGKNPGTQWTGDWVDPKAGLNAVENRESLASVGNRTPTSRSSRPQMVAIPNGLSQLLLIPRYLLIF
jgi:hypothetical protein